MKNIELPAGASSGHVTRIFLILHYKDIIKVPSLATVSTSRATSLQPFLVSVNNCQALLIAKNEDRVKEVSHEYKKNPSRHGICKMEFAQIYSLLELHHSACLSLMMRYFLILQYKGTVKDLCLAAILCPRGLKILSVKRFQGSPYVKKIPPKGTVPGVRGTRKLVAPSLSPYCVGGR